MYKKQNLLQLQRQLEKQAVELMRQREAIIAQSNSNLELFYADKPSLHFLDEIKKNITQKQENKSKQQIMYHLTQKFQNYLKKYANHNINKKLNDYNIKNQRLSQNHSDYIVQDHTIIGQRNKIKKEFENIYNKQYEIYKQLISKPEQQTYTPLKTDRPIYQYQTSSECINPKRENFLIQKKQQRFNYSSPKVEIKLGDHKYKYQRHTQPQQQLIKSGGDFSINYKFNSLQNKSNTQNYDSLSNYILQQSVSLQKNLAQQQKILLYNQLNSYIKKYQFQKSQNIYLHQHIKSMHEYISATMYQNHQQQRMLFLKDKEIQMRKSQIEIYNYEIDNLSQKSFRSSRVKNQEKLLLQRYKIDLAYIQRQLQIYKEEVQKLRVILNQSKNIDSEDRFGAFQTQLQALKHQANINKGNYLKKQKRFENLLYTQKQKQKIILKLQQKVQLLQKQIKEEQNKKQIFFNDLKIFKDKMTSLQKENQILKKQIEDLSFDFLERQRKKSRSKPKQKQSTFCNYEYDFKSTPRQPQSQRQSYRNSLINRQPNRSNYYDYSYLQNKYDSNNRLQSKSHSKSRSKSKSKFAEKDTNFSESGSVFDFPSTNLYTRIK